MSFPYVPVFLALLFVYLVYSAWARLDARYPIAGALVLLVITAIVDAAGAVAAANTLAEYVFFLLSGGVVLLLVDHVREGRGAPTGPSPSGSPGPRETDSPEPTEAGQGPADHALDGAEQ